MVGRGPGFSPPSPPTGYTRPFTGPVAVQTRTGMPLGQTVGISVSRSHPRRFAQPSPHPKSRTAPHLRPPPCHTLTARTAPRPRAPPQALATTHSSVCHRYNVLAVGTLCNCNHSACGLFRWIPHPTSCPRGPPSCGPHRRCVPFTAAAPLAWMSRFV